MLRRCTARSSCPPTWRTRSTQLFGQAREAPRPAHEQRVRSERERSNLCEQDLRMRHGALPASAVSAVSAALYPLTRPSVASLVIKSNYNQRYASNGITSFVVRELARRGELAPPQEFVVRNDCPCGSTIGPIISASTGIRVTAASPECAAHARPEPQPCRRRNRYVMARVARPPTCARLVGGRRSILACRSSRCTRCAR